MVDHCNQAPAQKYLTVFDSRVTDLEEKANGMCEFLVPMVTAVVSAELDSWDPLGVGDPRERKNRKR